MNVFASILAGLAGAGAGWIAFGAVGRFAEATGRFEKSLAIALAAAASVGLCLRFGVASREFLVYAPLSMVLVGITLFDLRRHMIPHMVTVPGFALGLLIANWVLPGGLRDALLGAGLGAGILLLATLAEALRKKEIGGGDWKYAAMLGSFVGAQRIILAMALSGVMGLLGGIALLRFSRTPVKPRPLGPWLSAGAIASLLWN